MSLLSDEITNDPLTRSYSGMTEQEIADSLNTVNCSVNKSTMSASEVFNAINKTELNALTADEQVEVWNLLHMSVLNPFGLEATLLTDIFGIGSTTITSLKSLRKNQVSRAQELGIRTPVKVGHVQEAQG